MQCSSGSRLPLEAAAVTHDDRNVLYASAACAPNTNLQLHNFGTGSDASVQLSGGSTSSVRGTTMDVDVVMTLTDLNTLKLLPTLCKRITGTDCWIRMTSQFVQDASTNAVVAIVDDPSLLAANRAGSVTLDTTSSVLENFRLNMNTAVLTLTFDEPIHPLTLTPTAITLASDGSGAPAASHTLTGGTIQTATDGIAVSLLLTVADMVKIKAFGTLAVSAQTTWLSGTTSLIQDLRDNQNAAVSATQASGFTADSTAPRLRHSRSSTPIWAPCSYPSLSLSTWPPLFMHP